MSSIQYLIDWARQRQNELPMMDDTINRAAAELAALKAALEGRTATFRSLLERFMAAQDSDWYIECGDWPPNKELDIEVPIGLMRDIDAALKGSK